MKKKSIDDLEVKIPNSKGRDCKSRPAHTSLQTKDEHLDQRDKFKTYEQRTNRRLN